jgi:hypothetical protein
MVSAPFARLCRKYFSDFVEQCASVQQIVTAAPPRVAAKYALM